MTAPVRTFDQLRGRVSREHHDPSFDGPPPSGLLPGMHPCGAPRCTRWVLKGYVACAAHWRALPDGEREALAVAFRLRESDPQGFGWAVTRAHQLLAAQS